MLGGLAPEGLEYLFSQSMPVWINLADLGAAPEAPEAAGPEEPVLRAMIGLVAVAAAPPASSTAPPDKQLRHISSDLN